MMSRVVRVGKRHVHKAGDDQQPGAGATGHQLVYPGDGQQHVPHRQELLLPPPPQFE